jgi:UDPglucose 6-dehydrogenase
VREAPAQVVCRELLKLGARLQVFDPEAMGTFKEAFGEHQKLAYMESDYDALAGADGLVICTEWNQFRTPNFSRIKKALKTPCIFDGRNIFDPGEMKKHGFVYFSIGRMPIGVEVRK